MAYVRVKLEVGSKTYNVEIDPQADPQLLAQGFATKLTLPDPTRYRLHLVNAFEIREGVTLKLIKVEPDEYFRFLDDKS